ncbi:28 kDa heat- and acid-stable phosphoprotein-like isoform X2 [Cylas formicarius]|uniref:28 kDa heat- and acid-stable phosphoprotein-like isoform X2 n=1 Tax=Cylas formicarius TaxID=197179 RepID=UPI002958817C|nr:28 kDa heat- and acid-stable phosphoprotein-like isoform X2 [Cylas formicarius]
MPRGKFTNHKGRNRRFTNPEELEEERRRDEEKNWRKQQGGSSSEESEQEKDDKSSSGDSDSEESSEEDTGAKGVSNLIEIENPNRVQKKVKKVSTLKTDELHKPQLSRREREEIEKQKAHAHYQKLHAEGKTDQARADLARLAIIRQQREEAKKRREAEQKEKEDAVKAKTAQTQKALGKK